MKPITSPEITALEIIIIIIVAIALYWVGPRVVMWLTRHAFVTTYQRTLPKKDLEKRHKTLGGLFANVWRIIVVVIAGYAIFTHFFNSAALAPLFASAGIIGVAFGFGAQSLVKDFLSGVFIISENQYRVGDIIEIDGFGGTVERIGVRSTVIRDVEGNVHFFPNGVVQHVINKTMGYSKVYFTITVAPDTNISTASDIINRIGEEISGEEKWQRKVIEPPHFDILGDFNASSISLVVSGKTQPSDQWALTAEMRRRILREFEKEHIELGAASPGKHK
ncbi:MAG: mechanosensitive ion channel family protein [Candidatus Nanosynbacter sp.]|jgi:mscS mechanosensitive ion channel|nr:mechanosensitive ion channel family protein [Candidatus Nanosynbacter sp.]